MPQPFGALAPMPRNPARMPAAVENFAMDATINPLWDVAKGVGALATGNIGAPEVGAGLFGAMGLMSPGARGAAKAVRSLSEIDADLMRALKGTDWHPMDTATRSAAQLKEMGFPDSALGLVKERQSAVTASNREIVAIDKQLKSLLKGTDIEPMDVALRGPDGLSQISHMIPKQSFDEVVSLAQKRQKLTDQ